MTLAAEQWGTLTGLLLMGAILWWWHSKGKKNFQVWQDKKIKAWEQKQKLRD